MNRPAPAAVRPLITAAAIVVVVAGLRAAQSIVVPFLLSLFIALITAPLLLALTRRRVPRPIALLAVILVIVIVGTGLAALVASSVNEFIDTLPRYQVLMQQRLQAGRTWLDAHGLDVPQEALWSSVEIGSVVQVLAATLSNASGVLANTFLILLTAVFMLLEVQSLPAKLRGIFREPDRSIARLEGVVGSLNRYVAIKTAASLATGLLVTLWLRVLGVDFALLWGLVAFLLNYVPNVGSVIAAVPAVAVAFLQSGLGLAATTAAGYLVVNFLIGNVAEPRFTGRGLGLSPLVVVLSLVFWGWVLGPVGMLLSAPLTMIVKVGLESFDAAHWIVALLGPEPEEESAER